MPNTKPDPSRGDERPIIFCRGETHYLTRAEWHDVFNSGMYGEFYPGAPDSFDALPRTVYMSEIQDPTRFSIEVAQHCADCAPEFGCWDGQDDCRKRPLRSNQAHLSDEAFTVRQRVTSEVARQMKAFHVVMHALEAECNRMADARTAVEKKLNDALAKIDALETAGNELRNLVSARALSLKSTGARPGAVHIHQKAVTLWEETKDVNRTPCCLHESKLLECPHMIRQPDVHSNSLTWECKVCGRYVLRAKK